MNDCGCGNGGGDTHIHYHYHCGCDDHDCDDPNGGGGGGGGGGGNDEPPCEDWRCPGFTDDGEVSALLTIASMPDHGFSIWDR